MSPEIFISLPSTILIWLVTLAVPALAVHWVARGSGLLAKPHAGPYVDQSMGCAGCHRTLQPGWQHCAYCGHRLMDRE